MSLSCKKHTVTRENLPAPPKGMIHVVGRKCRCNHSWCPTCGLNVVRRAFYGMRSWAWRRVRTIVLTVDREGFTDGPAKAVAELEKERSAFIRELRRRGAEIEDYRWFAEWHRDGFPHYHFFLLMRDEGKAGQIGVERLRAAWRHGRYIHESWIKSAEHWEGWVGYAAKTGYIEKDKRWQTILPEWAQDKTRRVRRVGGKAKEQAARESTPEHEVRDEDFQEWINKVSNQNELLDFDSREKRSNREVLQSCGSKTTLLTILNVKGESVRYGVFNIPFRQFASDAGCYLERYGYVHTMRVIDFLDIYKNKCQAVSPKAEEVTQERTGGGGGRFSKDEIKSFENHFKRMR